MKKKIKSISIKGKKIGFSNALLYVGNNGGITYILDLDNPRGLPQMFQNEILEIVTEEGETKEIKGTIDRISDTDARIYVVGEPFPLTPQEKRKFL